MAKNTISKLKYLIIQSTWHNIGKPKQYFKHRSWASLAFSFALVFNNFETVISWIISYLVPRKRVRKWDIKMHFCFLDPGPDLKLCASLIATITDTVRKTPTIFYQLKGSNGALENLINNFDLDENVTHWLSLLPPHQIKDSSPHLRKQLSSQIYTLHKHIDTEYNFASVHLVIWVFVIQIPETWQIFHVYCSMIGKL